MLDLARTERFVANADGVARTNASVAQAQIRRDIVGLRLQPGEKLRLARLKNKYGFGLAPLREALSRLTAEGFVDLADQKGFSVSPISEDDLRDVTSVRQLLECTALRLAIERGDDEWESNIVAIHHQLSKPRERRQEDETTMDEAWEVRHRAFHFALLSACGSPRLLAVRGLLYDQSDRYRRLAAKNQTAERDILEEHSRICEATIARNPGKACRLLNAHIGRTAEIAMTMVDVWSARNR